MKRALILAVAFMLVLTLFSGCAKKESVLKVGTSADYPPFEYVDEKTKEFVGFDLDLMRLLGKKMGYDKVEIVNMDFDTIIPSLQADKIDVGAACITITDERLQQADAVPYLSTGQSILVKKDSTYAPKTFEDLSNHKIGVQKGTTGEEAIDKAITDGKIKNADVRRYTSVVLAITDLQNGNIDAVIIDTPVATYYSTKQDFKVTGELVSEQAGLFVKKGNTELKTKLEKALSEVKGTQDWNDLINKYFGG
ncbi:MULTISPECIES: basic amino acid ABC transporter substrate-binding protein [Caldisericum]|jgi:polar amino acid transport system substrate-binding protein|uniref:Basic amino acid ABC transporter substrate-binding protein n=1 Tax=Caldisericum exile TaxID=693075 RepID=A0A2J6WF95_9BACT|nr:MAG: basic amino acid ABC transporter substrate-binding protein [Caldisericum exile]